LDCFSFHCQNLLFEIPQIFWRFYFH
jgi:hypothetical protein